MQANSLPDQSGRLLRRVAGRERRHAFTLIEMLVVILIIGLLIGLLFAFTSQSVTRVSQTRMTFQLLLNVADEHKARTRIQINHYGSRPNDWNSSRPCTNHTMSCSGKPDDSSERFVAAVMEVPESAELVQNLAKNNILVDLDDPDGDEVPNPDGFLELRDAWGNMIVYMASNDQNPSSGGNRLLPARTRRFFASAGDDPQGLFGDHAGPDGVVGTGDDTVKNDLYSFEIE